MSREKEKIFLGELIFWLHTAIIVLIVMSGLFVPLWAVVLIIVAVKIHQIILGGCILTIWQARLGGIKRGMPYFQLATQRFFKLNIGKVGVQVVSLIVAVMAFSVSLIANHQHFRVNF